MHMTVIKNTDWNFKVRNKQFSLKARLIKPLFLEPSQKNKTKTKSLSSLVTSIKTKYSRHSFLWITWPWNPIIISIQGNFISVYSVRYKNVSKRDIDRLGQMTKTVAGKNPTHMTRLLCLKHSFLLEMYNSLGLSGNCVVNLETYFLISSFFPSFCLSHLCL